MADRNMYPIDCYDGPEEDLAVVTNIVKKYGKIEITRGLRIGISGRGNLKCDSRECDMFVIEKAQISPKVRAAIDRVLDNLRISSVWQKRYDLSADDLISPEDMRNLFLSLSSLFAQSPNYYFFLDGGVLTAAIKGDGYYRIKRMGEYDRSGQISKVVQRILKKETSVQDLLSLALKNQELINSMNNGFCKALSKKLENFCDIQIEVKDETARLMMSDPKHIFETKELQKYNIYSEENDFSETAVRALVEKKLASAIQEHNRTSEDKAKNEAMRLISETLKEVYNSLPGVAFIAESKKAITIKTVFGTAKADKQVSPDQSVVSAMIEERPHGHLGRMDYSLSENSRMIALEEATRIAKKHEEAFLLTDTAYSRSETVTKLVQGCRSFEKKYTPGNMALYAGKPLGGSSFNQGSLKFHFDPFTNKAWAETRLGRATIDASLNISLKESAGLQEYLHDLGLVRFKAAMEYVRTAVKEHKLEVKYKSGAGLLYGKTTVQTRGYGINQTFSWDGPSYKEGLKAFRSYCSSWCASTEAALKKEADNLARKLGDSIRPYQDSFLARDIALFVSQNASYITENAMVNNLRGLKETFGGIVRNIPHSAGYNMISSDEVRSVTRTMKTAGLIGQKRVKGTYGDFWILKNTEALSRLPSWPAAEYDAGEVYKEASSDPITNDQKAKVLFEAAERYQGPLSIDHFFALLNLSYAHGFVCLNHEKYLSLFACAPKEFLDYVKMQKAMEEDPVAKKVMIEITKPKKKA